MKKSKAATAETRKRIVEAAAIAFQSHGIDATGVAEIMAAAGLSHGGFYRHFASKDQLVAEAVQANGRNLATGCEAAASEGAEAVLALFRDYVTRGHCDRGDVGCPLAANGSELARADEHTRHVATEGFRKIIESTAPFMHAETGEEPLDASISVLTHMIGALTMARMVDDPALSDRILAVTRKRVTDSIDLAAKRELERSTQGPD